MARPLNETLLAVRVILKMQIKSMNHHEEHEEAVRRLKKIFASGIDDRRFSLYNEKIKELFQEELTRAEAAGKLKGYEIGMANARSSFEEMIRARPSPDRE